MNKNNDNSLIKENWIYIEKENIEDKYKKYLIKKLYSAVIYFLIGTIIGGALVFYVTNGFSDIPNLKTNYENDDFYSDFLSIGNNPDFIEIFINNLTVCFILVAGILTLGIITRLILLINGVVIGVIVFSYIPLGYNIILPLLALFPHAVLELPALFLAGAIGMHKFKYISELSWKTAIKLLCIILIFLLTAAIIEAFISVRVADIMLP